MNGSDPNFIQAADASGSVSGKNCLHIAAERGFEEMVHILLEFNADIYSKDTNGFTAMDLAEQHQHQSVVDTLKSALLVQEKMRIDLYECLVIAVHKGDIQEVKNLLKKAYCLDSISSVQSNDSEQKFVHKNLSTTSLVNYVTNGSNTLLFKACQEGHLEIVQLLISVGSDGRVHPVTKYSPLYISAYNGRLHICQLLLQHFPELAAIFTVEHWLPLHAAAINNHQDIVELLLNYDYPSYVMQPFICRCDSSFPIVTNQSPISLFKSSHSKSSAHSKSDSKQDSNNLYYIYLKPFDVNAQDIAGQSLLFIATLLGNKSLVQFMLNYRTRAIAYLDYAVFCGKDHSKDISVDNFELIGCQNELEFIFFGFENNKQTKSDIDLHDHDNKEKCNSSSSSSQEDITVISPINFDVKSSHSQEERKFFEKSQFSPIQRLIDRLTPSSSLLKQQATSNTQLQDSNNNITVNKISRKNFSLKKSVFSKSKPTMFMVNPFTIDLYCNYNMETALHCAVKKRNYSIASLLLESGANPNLTINGQQYKTNPSIVTRVSHFNHNFFHPS